MADVDWSTQGLMISGVSATTLQKALKHEGHTDFQIAGVLGAILAGVSYAQPTAFRFGTPVEASDPSCAVTYRRTFAHDDWADGRSRVQAGTTPDELGFNARFHELERELDAVADQFGGLGRCVAGLRGDLYGVVRELETILSDLRRQVAELRREQSPTLPRLEDWAKKQKVVGYHANEAGKMQILLQKGEEVAFIDAREFVGNFAATFAPERDVKDVVLDLGSIADAIESDAAVRRRIGFGATRDEIVEEMGGRVLVTEAGVVTLAEALADVPGNTRFTSVEELSDAFATAAVNRAGGGDTGHVRSEVLGRELQDATVAKVRAAEVGELVVVSPEVSRTIAAAGYSTIGQLAGESAGALVKAAAKAGLDLTHGQATAAVGAARMGLKVAGRGR